MKPKVGNELPAHEAYKLYKLGLLAWQSSDGRTEIIQKLNINHILNIIKYMAVKRHELLFIFEEEVQIRCKNLPSPNTFPDALNHPEKLSLPALRKWSDLIDERIKALEEKRLEVNRQLFLRSTVNSLIMRIFLPQDVFKEAPQKKAKKTTKSKTTRRKKK